MQTEDINSIPALSASKCVEEVNQPVKKDDLILVTLTGFKEGGDETGLRGFQLPLPHNVGWVNKQSKCYAAWPAGSLKELYHKIEAFCNLTRGDNLAYKIQIYLPKSNTWFDATVEDYRFYLFPIENNYLELVAEFWSSCPEMTQL